MTEPTFPVDADTASRSELFKLRSQIASLVDKDNKCRVEFLYDDTSKTLSIYTYNPHHGATFLLDSESVKLDNPLEAEMKATEQILTRLRNTRPTPDMRMYEIEWMHKGTTHVSYFSSFGIMSALDKFFAHNSINEHTHLITQITLKPIA